MVLATKIMKDKIKWFQNVVLTDGLTFFPIKLDYSWPEPFDTVLSSVGYSDEFRLKPMYNMTTVIPKAMQEYIMDIIFKFIQNEGRIYRKEINRLVVNIINQEKQCHHDIKSHNDTEP